MKVCIVSDSHLMSGLSEVISREGADINIHTGDSQQMKNNREVAGFDHIIRGNCDFEKYPEHDIVEIDGQLWLIIHRHQVYNAHDLTELAAYAKDFGCSVVCYGHTHVAVYAHVDGVTILNSGSFARSRSSYPNSYMTIDIENHKWTVKLKYAENGCLIKELTVNG